MQTRPITQPLIVPISNLEPETPTLSAVEGWDLKFRSYLFNRKPRLAPRSIELAIQHIRVYARWHENTFNTPFQPSDLTNYDLHLYRAYSLDIEKVRAATWNSRRWALAHLCDWISTPELMHSIEEKNAGRASTKHRSLTDDEYHRLIHALENAPRRAITTFERQNAIRDYAAIILMLHGLRVSEVISLHVDDITINQRSGEVRVRNGKGSKERTIPLNLLGRKALASQLEVNLTPATDNLFFTRTVRSLQRDVSALGDQIGVPDLTPHWLRYTFAKRLERKSVSIETIRDLLGHSTIEQTKRYLRSSTEELQSAVEEIM